MGRGRATGPGEGDGEVRLGHGIREGKRLREREREMPGAVYIETTNSSLDQLWQPCTSQGLEWNDMQLLSSYRCAGMIFNGGPAEQVVTYRSTGVF
jgi:hypothetical protein